MMNDTSGLAFPCEGGDMSGLHAHPGMTLRDYFAGQALAGICTGCGFQGGPWDHMALDAYRAADAMLAARAKDRT